MKNMENTESEGKKKEVLRAWEMQRCREILVYTGKVTDFEVSDIDKDELRQIVENVRHSQRMHEPEYAETREAC